MDDIPPILLPHFPLAGEWHALRTPAAGVPTHGTDFLGQRFAYDFCQPTGRWWAPYGPLTPLHLYTGVPVRSFTGWGSPVEAAAAGTVLVAADGWKEARWVHASWNLARMTLLRGVRPVRISIDDWRPLTGNYCLVEGTDGIALYAHLRPGSLRVRAGDRVTAGDPIGAVGHSGRSSMPHLHFHLMDRPTIAGAQGILCGFEALERRDGAGWHPADPIPGLRQRIRRAR